MRRKKTTTEEPVMEVAPAEEKKTEKKAKPKTVRKPRATKKKKEEELKTETTEQPQTETKAEATEPKQDETKQAEAKQAAEAKQTAEAKTEEPKQAETKPQPLAIPSLPNMRICNIIELAQAPQRAIILTDQQIQQLTLEDIEKRHRFLEETLCNVLDYDIVISDTNIWLELLVGHTSSHSDPRVNARLQFERQLEFISKLMKHRGGKFVIMGETYEEIDRFAAMQDPTNHKEADFTDNIVCLNAAARLAKRLILAQQRENRLRIEGISAESHHASFADPAIVRRVVELFAEGKKVLLITNDSSVAIRSIGLCDDMQRHNNISDENWNELYVPLRPMVFTFDDLKLLDYYTRQYHYIQMASGQPWMTHCPPLSPRTAVEPLTLWQEAFRPGDKHRGDNLFIGAEPENVTAQKQQPQQKQQKQRNNAKQKKDQQKKEQQKNDSQNTAAPKGKGNEPETPKQETPKQEALKQEALKQETQKPETQKPETPAKRPVRRRSAAKKSAEK